MTKFEGHGYIEDGKLHIINRKRMNEDLRTFKNCDVTIIIKKRGKRSLPQNAYYWGVVVKEIQLRMRELGNDVDCDTVHEFLKLKFNPERVVVPETAEVIEMGKTTTELNKDEFTEYIEQIKQWASVTLGIYIPDAGQQTEMFAA